LLAPLFTDVLAQLLDIHLDIQIEYQQGWNKDEDLAAVLSHSYPRDAALGYTQYGPHRADLKAIIYGFLAKDFLSRGQQKLFVCAMILAQGKLLSNLTKKRPIFLVDDLPSELDSFSLKKMVSLLEELATQVFITAIDVNTIAKFSKEQIKLFHVEHGKVILR
jgi:DNA replication and repair protein RecF